MQVETISTRQSTTGWCPFSDWLTDQEKVNERAKEILAEVEANTVRIGSIFESSWGYDQTNVDFYVVVGISKSGKSVEIQQVGHTVVDGRVVPDVDNVFGEVKTKRLTTGYQGVPTVKVRSWGVWAYLWDGKPAYDTSAAGEVGH